MRPRDYVTISTKLFNIIIRDVNIRGHRGEKVTGVEIVRSTSVGAGDDGYIVYTDDAETSADASGW